MVVTNFIIGTAGHAGHGKTALVEALTGVATDAGPKEKEHCRSIDLGFAPLYLPSGATPAVVDLPGSARFIRNALVGLSSVDLLVLVIAADEGVCAQTIEHLDLAALLGIRQVVVAVTKIDLVGADQVDEVRNAVGDLLSSRSLAGAPVVPISVRRREGLSELITAIEERACGLSPRPLDLPVRLPLDRSFVLPAAGRVVTGALWSGVLAADDELELVRSKEIFRPLRIEVHGQSVSKALPGQRAALNIVVPGDPPKRGDWVTAPGVVMPAREVIAQVRILPQLGQGLKDGAIVRIYHGTQASLADIHMIEGEILEPGDQGLVRIRPRQPLLVAFRDHFVLRSGSSAVTLGGGLVLESYSGARGHLAACSRWRLLVGGSDSEIVKELFGRCLQPLTIEDTAQTLHIGESAAAVAIERLVGKEALSMVKAWRCAFYLDTRLLTGAGRALREYLDEYRRRHPYDFGPPVENVRTALWAHLSASQSDILLTHFINEGLTVRSEGRLGVRAASEFPPARQKMAELHRRLRGFTPPGRAELEESDKVAAVDLDHLLARLEAEGRIIQLAPDTYFTVEAIGEAREMLTEYLLEAGEITQVRFSELLGTTEKYADPLCRYFDREMLTRCTGGVRVLYGP